MLLSLLASTVLAASASGSFADVPQDAWYAKAAYGLRDSGMIADQSHFRPADHATRAEFLKLTLGVAKRTPGTPPLLPSFDDVPKHAWYYALMEEAAKEGWVRGDGNCYGSTSLTTGGIAPCHAYPEKGISRAEASALLVRILLLERTKTVRHMFIDVGDTDWFAYAMFSMADRCLLKGDPLTLRIRPHDRLNRAEMAVLFRRVQAVLKGVSACGT
jgi:hypothetical protein